MPSINPQSGPEEQEWVEPPQLRALRRMVAVLTATLIIGVLTIAATLVIRILMEEPPAPTARLDAAEISLPVGEEITAVGATPSALSIATKDGAGAERIRVFHPQTGAPMGETAITRR